VDGNYATPAGGGDPVYEPVSQEQLDSIQRMVQTAIGIDTARGDRIEVVNIQFRPDATDGEGDGGLPGGWLELVLQNLGRILLVALLVVLVAVFRRSLSGALGDLAGMHKGGHGSTVEGTAKPAAPEGERFEGLPELTDQMIEDVREYAAENPARVAEVVQSWLYEPERSGR